MNKEELIALLTTLKMEEIKSFEINYFDKKEEERYGYSQPKERKLLVIEFNKLGGKNE